MALSSSMAWVQGPLNGNKQRGARGSFGRLSTDAALYVKTRNNGDAVNAIPQRRKD